jgi:hypothetical protein
MKKLILKYRLLKAKALELMQAGKVNAYLATLVEVENVKRQLNQLASGR